MRGAEMNFGAESESPGGLGYGSWVVVGGLW
jgi:hypothetical protein